MRPKPRRGARIQAAPSASCSPTAIPASVGPHDSLKDVEKHGRSSRVRPGEACRSPTMVRGSPQIDGNTSRTSGEGQLPRSITNIVDAPRGAGASRPWRPMITVLGTRSTRQGPRRARIGQPETCSHPDAGRSMARRPPVGSAPTYATQAASHTAPLLATCHALVARQEAACAPQRPTPSRRVWDKRHPAALWRTMAGRGRAILWLRYGAPCRGREEVTQRDRVYSVRISSYAPHQCVQCIVSSRGEYHGQ